VTTDLFESYFETIFSPQIKGNRINMNKPNKKAVVLMDGFCAHSSEKLKKLQEDNNVKFLFIPPHSSQLTHPFDLLIFANFKKLMPKLSTTLQMNPLSKRIAMALKGIQMSTSFFDIHTAFHRAGIETDVTSGKEKIVM